MSSTLMYADNTVLPLGTKAHEDLGIAVYTAVNTSFQYLVVNGEDNKPTNNKEAQRHHFKTAWNGKMECLKVSWCDNWLLLGLDPKH